MKRIFTTCYLCDKTLDKNTSVDHIIPYKLFLKNDPNRPKLIVHNKCNNLKSKEDEWFIRQVQLRSSINPQAEEEFSVLIERAISEKPNAFIIGEKLHNYKLARGIFNETNWELEIPYKGSSLYQLRFSKKNVERFEKYLITMCRGLYIYNIPESNPKFTRMLINQYMKLELKGRKELFLNSIRALITMSPETRFTQQWSSRILYVGNRVLETPNKGYIFIEFYSQFGVLVNFS